MLNLILEETIKITIDYTQKMRKEFKHFIIKKKKFEAKGKGEKERYTHLSAEFQRIAKRDKKAFLSEQCKEIEENNKMGKTRDFFKKIGDAKEIFHAKMDNKGQKWHGPNGSRRH